MHSLSTNDLRENSLELSVTGFVASTTNQNPIRQREKRVKSAGVSGYKRTAVPVNLRRETDSRRITSLGSARVKGSNKNMQNTNSERKAHSAHPRMGKSPDKFMGVDLSDDTDDDEFITAAEIMEKKSSTTPDISNSRESPVILNTAPNNNLSPSDTITLLSERDKGALKVGRLVLASAFEKEDSATTADAISRFFFDAWLGRNGSSLGKADTLSIEFMATLQKAKTEVEMFRENELERLALQIDSEEKVLESQKKSAEKRQCQEIACAMAFGALDYMVKEFGEANPVLREVRDILAPCIYLEPPSYEDCKEMLIQSDASRGQGEASGSGLVYEEPSRLTSLGQQYASKKTWYGDVAVVHDHALSVEQSLQAALERVRLLSLRLTEKQNELNETIEENEAAMVKLKDDLANSDSATVDIQKQLDMKEKEIKRLSWELAKEKKKSEDARELSKNYKADFERYRESHEINMGHLTNDLKDANVKIDEMSIAMAITEKHLAELVALKDSMDTIVREHEEKEMELADRLEKRLANDPTHLSAAVRAAGHTEHYYTYLECSERYLIQSFNKHSRLIASLREEIVGGQNQLERAALELEAQTKKWEDEKEQMMLGFANEMQVMKSAHLYEMQDLHRKIRAGVAECVKYSNLYDEAKEKLANANSLHVASRTHFESVRDDLTTKLGAADAALLETKKKLDTVVKSEINLKIQYESVSSQLTMVSNDLAIATKTVQEQLLELTDLRQWETQRDEMKAEILSLNERVDALELDRVMFKDQVLELTTAKNSLEVILSELQSKLMNAEAERDQRIAEVETIEAVRKDLIFERDSLAEKLADHTATADAAVKILSEGRCVLYGDDYAVATLKPYLEMYTQFIHPIEEITRDLIPKPVAVENEVKDASDPKIATSQASAPQSAAIETEAPGSIPGTVTPNLEETLAPAVFVPASRRVVVLKKNSETQTSDNELLSVLLSEFGDVVLSRDNHEEMREELEVNPEDILGTIIESDASASSESEEEGSSEHEHEHEEGDLVNVEEEVFDEVLVDEHDPQYLHIPTFEPNQGLHSGVADAVSEPQLQLTPVLCKAIELKPDVDVSLANTVDPLPPTVPDGLKQEQKLTSDIVPQGKRRIRVPRTVISKKPYVSAAKNSTASLHVVQVEALDYIPGSDEKLDVTSASKIRLKKRREMKNSDKNCPNTEACTESRYSNCTSKNETPQDSDTDAVMDPGGLTVVKKRIAPKEKTHNLFVKKAEFKRKSRQAQATATYISSSEKNSQNIKDVMIKLLQLVATSRANMKAAESECSSLKDELDSEQKKNHLMTKQVENYKDQLSHLLKKTVGKQDTCTSNAPAPRRYSAIHREALGNHGGNHTSHNHHPIAAVPLHKRHTFVGEDGVIETVDEEDFHPIRKQKQFAAETKGGIKIVRAEKTKAKHDTEPEDLKPKVEMVDMACGPDIPPPIPKNRSTMTNNETVSKLSKRKRPPEDVSPFVGFLRQHEKRYSKEVGKMTVLLREAYALVQRVVNSLDGIVPETVANSSMKLSINVENLGSLINHILRDIEQHEWVFGVDLPAEEVSSHFSHCRYDPVIISSQLRACATYNMTVARLLPDETEYSLAGDPIVVDPDPATKDYIDLKQKMLVQQQARQKKEGELLKKRAEELDDREANLKELQRHLDAQQDMLQKTQRLMSPRSNRYGKGASSRGSPLSSPSRGSRTASPIEKGDSEVGRVRNSSMEVPLVGTPTLEGVPPDEPALGPHLISDEISVNTLSGPISAEDLDGNSTGRSIRSPTQSISSEVTCTENPPASANSHLRSQSVALSSSSGLMCPSPHPIISELTSNVSASLPLVTGVASKKELYGGLINENLVETDLDHPRKNAVERETVFSIVDGVRRDIEYESLCIGDEWKTQLYREDGTVDSNISLISYNETERILILQACVQGLKKEHRKAQKEYRKNIDKLVAKLQEYVVLNEDQRITLELYETGKIVAAENSTVVQNPKVQEMSAMGADGVSLKVYFDMEYAILRAVHMLNALVSYKTGTDKESRVGGNLLFGHTGISAPPDYSNQALMLFDNANRAMPSHSNRSDGFNHNSVSKFKNVDDLNSKNVRSLASNKKCGGAVTAPKIPLKSKKSYVLRKEVFNNRDVDGSNGACIDELNLNNPLAGGDSILTTSLASSYGVSAGIVPYGNSSIAETNDQSQPDYLGDLTGGSVVGVDSNGLSLNNSVVSGVGGLPLEGSIDSVPIHKTFVPGGIRNQIRGSRERSAKILQAYMDKKPDIVTEKLFVEGEGMESFLPRYTQNPESLYAKAVRSVGKKQSERQREEKIMTDTDYMVMHTRHKLLIRSLITLCDKVAARIIMVEDCSAARTVMDSRPVVQLPKEQLAAKDRTPADTMKILGLEVGLENDSTGRELSDGDTKKQKLNARETSNILRIGMGDDDTEIGRPTNSDENGVGVGQDSNTVGGATDSLAGDSFVNFNGLDMGESVMTIGSGSAVFTEAGASAVHDNRNDSISDNKESLYHPDQANLTADPEPTVSSVSLGMKALEINEEINEHIDQILKLKMKLESLGNAELIDGVKNRAKEFYNKKMDKSQTHDGGDSLSVSHKGSLDIFDDECSLASLDVDTIPIQIQKHPNHRQPTRTLQDVVGHDVTSAPLPQGSVAKNKTITPPHIQYAMDLIVGASAAANGELPVSAGSTANHGRIPISDDGLGTFRKQIKGLPSALRVASDPSFLEPPSTIVSSRGHELPFPLLENNHTRNKHNISHLKRFNNSKK